MPAARRRLILAIPLAVALLARVAAAQGDPVEQLIAILNTKPDGMGEDEWKEKRREAAIELGRRGERKAVDALIKVIETEEFDIVAEHAIEALGKIGDKRAIPVLQKVAGDNDRDPDARRKARAALDKLGGAEAPPPGGDDDGDDDDDGGGFGRVGGRVLGGGKVEVPEPPVFPEDTLAASERLIFGLGALSFEYDSLRDSPAFSGDATAAYERIRERERLGLDLSVDAGVAGGTIDFPGGGSASRFAVIDVRGRAEARAYFGPQAIFALAALDLGAATTYIRVNRPIMGGDTNVTRVGLDATITVGGGFGRVLERGDEIRLRRIEKALRDGRVLGRKITKDLAEKILAMWWSLRGEISTHKQLVATVSMLRDAGVLLEEPSASTTYEILRILEDGQLASRPDGLQVALGISETLITRDDDLGLEEGRIENVIARARYGLQRPDGENEIVGQGAARYRILANQDDGDPTPWVAVASAAYRRYMYNDTFDPVGALELGAELGASDDGNDGDSVAGRVGGRIGWLFALSRFSRVRIAGEMAIEAGEIFIGASLEAAYGFIDVSFIGKPGAL